MTIPLLHELQYPGFHELNFTPLYNPGLLVCHRSEVDSQNLPVAKKGIFVPVVTHKKGYAYDIYIGCSGFDSETHPLVNRLHRVCNPDIGLKIAGKWDKAVLLFDWQDDIEACAKQKGPYNDLKKFNWVNEIMDNEAYYLKGYFADKFRKDMKLKVDGGQRTKSFFLPNPDVQRYECYFGLVKELVQMIIDGKI